MFDQSGRAIPPARLAKPIVSFSHKIVALKGAMRSPGRGGVGTMNAHSVPAAMIPLRDSEASRRITPANTLLILANVAVFAFEIRLGAAAEPMLWRFAMVPARITHLAPGVTGLGFWPIVTLVTSLFLHAGLLHIIGNMLYLLIFGPAVEERMGHARFLGFYLGAGVVAGLAMVAMGPESHVPVIGASGAIAGVLGAYFMLYPRGRIFAIFDMPAIYYLLIWFAIQLYSGIAAGAHGPLVGGVAWWAHVGGFLFGVAAAPMLTHSVVKKRRRRAISW